MGFKKGRVKTGGRTKGTRNKVNMFNQETIEQAKAVIAEQVAQGDIEASKLVLSYSLSKPVSHQVGIVAELEQAQTQSALNQLIKREKEAEFFSV